MFETQLPQKKRSVNMKLKLLKVLTQITLVDIVYGMSAFMSRRYWDMGTGFGDLLVSVFAVFLYHCTKACVKECREERLHNA